MARVIHVFRRPDRFVAGTVGEPGDRAFYLQAIESSRTISVLLEKQQVSVLAERITALLGEVSKRFGEDNLLGATVATGSSDSDPLAVPLEEEFRVGTMGLGWDADSSSIVVELLAVTEEEIDESVVLDDTEEGPDALRVFLSPTAAKAFAERAEKVVDAGRAPCPLCAEPLDPEGHVCVRLNGYHDRNPVAGTE
ncbi:DUF3090 domain-containing protein [Pseudonocardia alni]|jgi:uncharacterized repeat protein (TIGR03847 family)|uniref:Repeat protein (TIGR03847 family) n=1 Tax=Pseudonocardia alni TaxID=33907 RepID=A0A852VZL7_PSEA5|nr:MULTISPECIES: DUF3090 domain-containing protein [Pseudonocardia]OJG06831.1 hypothetical protein BG618_01965 [Pseudonocardia autotrophica]MCO7192089.1 DUF3090 domain-containing protein [Pseudonocardia sp. McavD-2-B]MYW73530.1 DUF3090 family protein [Pseudonocardia sp. SID8383]NYG01550.1 putative repeat protein (TIGR03847 family) [Pseudonocardia antarctica]PKB32888.1 putative repeat protein (TIGR03847 family) [Pseudonocardia alni]